MDYFNYHFSFPEIGLLALLLVAFLVQLYFYLRYFWGIIRHRKEVENEEIVFNEHQPPVSVVICARDEEENLRKFLPFVLEQEYPEYEVIVVNDGSTDLTEDFLSLMTKQYSHLRTTFVPEGATNLSTKKLGVTLGIKAAKYDYILLTDADCMPEGKEWIAQMMRNFTDEVEFVLGYGGYLKKKGFLNKLIKYDTLFIAIQYLGMAEAHRPYMGVGRNLAYRKETFFRMKGFASSLNLASGDDDLLVNQGSTKENTVIEVSKESTTWSEPKTKFKNWYIQKERHLSVANNYNFKSKARLAGEPISRGIFYLSALVLGVIGICTFNWIELGIALFLLLVRFGIQLYVINQSAKTLGEQRFYFTIPLFDLFLPLVSLYLFLFGRKKERIKWK